MISRRFGVGIVFLMQIVSGVLSARVAWEWDTIDLSKVSFDKNKMAELWTPTLKAWFPEGLEDPELALIKVEVERAEIWDSPPSKVVKLVGMAKAMMTGKPYTEAGDHRQIDIKSH